MSEPVAVCNLCGGKDFGPGPGGRLADSGLVPHCRHCGSLERQRILRRIFQALPLGFLDWRHGLQLGADKSLSPHWFRTYEIASPMVDESLNLHTRTRPDAGFDFISFNHFLEFMADDHSTFVDLVHSLSPNGLLQAGFSAPLSRPLSQDFEQPCGPHGAWHLYGRDLEQRFRCHELELTVLVVEEADPCTGVREAIHLICKEPDDAKRLRLALTCSGSARIITLT
jgi:hypothetical protein